MENKYMMLDRLVQDAKYYVGDMAVSEKHLYYGSVDDQTVAIRKLFNSFTGKPGDEKPAVLVRVLGHNGDGDAVALDTTVKEMMDGNPVDCGYWTFDTATLKRVKLDGEFLF